jgi:two-component system cell cycle response regulator CtrA
MRLPTAPLPGSNAMSLVINTGKISLHLDSRAVEVGGQLLGLTAKEYRIFELLSLHKGQALSRASLLDHLYPTADQPYPRIINVFICHLRKKLSSATGGDSYIETVYGRGYVLRDPNDRD